MSADSICVVFRCYTKSIFVEISMLHAASMKRFHTVYIMHYIYYQEYSQCYGIIPRINEQIAHKCQHSAFTVSNSRKIKRHFHVSLFSHKQLKLPWKL